MAIEARAAAGRPTRDGEDVFVVRDLLRRKILDAEIAPGSILSQADLARTLPVGRTPLREALRMLQQEGLVISRPNRRAQVSPLSADDAEELYGLRITLECVAVRTTAASLTRRDVAQLTGLLAQVDQLAGEQEWGLVNAPHREFHARLVAGAGPRTAQVVERLADHSERYRRAFGATAPGGHEARRVEHQAILDAVAAGNPERAAVELALHYLHTVRIVLAAIDPDRSMERLQATAGAVAPAIAGRW